MTSRLTKSQLRSKLDLTSDAALADFFGITRAAIAQWADDKPIPELRQLQAERLRPDVFGGEGPGPRRSGAAPEGGDAAQTDATEVQPMSEAA
jgi:hypothetical protein